MFSDLSFYLLHWHWTCTNETASYHSSKATENAIGPLRNAPCWASQLLQSSQQYSYYNQHNKFSAMTIKRHTQFPDDTYPQYFPSHVFVIFITEWEWASV